VLLNLLLSVAILGAVLVAPVAAGFLVLFESKPFAARAVAWLGVSMGLGTASVFPLLSLFLAINAQAWGYRLAPLFGLLGLALGAGIVRSHLHNLDGIGKPRRALAHACLVFGLLVAAALTPVLAGAAPPGGCGEFAAEGCGPGTFQDYATVVLPVLILMGLEAWLLLRLASKTA
jgi:hypothetical protein